MFTRSYSYLTFNKGQDSRPSNGNHRNTQPVIPGKYHQSQNNQQSWSRRQRVPNYISGANGTPLGSPPRMSPVDSSAVDSSANAAKSESELGKKQNPEALDEVRAAIMCILPTTTNLRRPSHRTRHNKSLKRKGTTFPMMLKRQWWNQVTPCQNYLQIERAKRARRAITSPRWPPKKIETRRNPRNGNGRRLMVMGPMLSNTQIRNWRRRGRSGSTRRNERIVPHQNKTTSRTVR